MEVRIINKEGCLHTVTSDEQLAIFLAAGWAVVEPEPKKATRTATKKDKK